MDYAVLAAWGVLVLVVAGVLVFYWKIGDKDFDSLYYPPEDVQ